MPSRTLCCDLSFEAGSTSHVEVREDHLVLVEGAGGQRLVVVEPVFHEAGPAVLFAFQEQQLATQVVLPPLGHAAGTLFTSMST